MKTFSALGTIVSVSIDNGMSLADVAHALVAPFPGSEQPAELHYELAASGMQRDGIWKGVDHPDDVVPLFELDLYEQIGTRAPRGWLLHAAALEVDHRALVLCGPSGAGKTTLTLALTARGYRLLTEEMVWIGSDGTVRGLPRAIHVPAGSRQLARLPATWPRWRYPIRDASRGTNEAVIVVPPREVFVHEVRQLAAIVRIGHGPDWDAELRLSPHAEALQRLWDRSLRTDEGGLQVATEVLREYPSYTLASRTEEQALSLLQPLLK